MKKGSEQLRDILNTVPLKRNNMEQRLKTKVKPLKEQRKIVTPKEWKFIQELITGDGRCTMKEAAIRAGYAPDKAGHVANRLTDPKRSPHVVAAIQEYRRELADQYGTTFERHMRDLQAIRDAALDAGNFGAAVTAEYRRGQALGTIYVDRKEIRHGTIDSMSKEEVRRKLEELQQLYGGPPPKQIIDMTPEELSEKQELEQIEYQPTIIEEMRDGEGAGVTLVPETERELAESGDHEAGESSGSWDSGLPDSPGEGLLGDDGIESGEEWEEGEDESAPDSLSTEACRPGDADIHPGSSPEDGDNQAC